MIIVKMCLYNSQVAKVVILFFSTYKKSVFEIVKEVENTLISFINAFSDIYFCKHMCVCVCVLVVFCICVVLLAKL